MKKKKTLAALEPYLWLLPSILLMTIFILFPIFEVFRTSMSEVSKAGLVKGFCGFDNFAKVLRGSTFKLVLKNTLVWTIAVVVISTVFGFILALVLNNKFRFRKAVRAIIVFPWATSLIIQAGVWKFIIDKDYGALNTLLMKLHIIATDPEDDTGVYTVVIPKRADATDEQARNRQMPDIKWSAQLEGAVHSVKVNGTLRVTLNG